MGGAVGLALAGCKKKSSEPGGASGRSGPSEDTREVVIGYVSPQTGPLAPFAAADAFIVDRVVKALDAKAIMVDGKKARFRVQRADSQSNPTRAGEVAQSLISGDKVDLMVVAHTPDTTNPVGAVCEATRTPCISTAAPIGPWLSGAPYEWTFHFFWDLPDIIKVFTGMWDTLPTNKVVGALWPNDPDGTAWTEAFTKALTEKGYKVIDPGRYPNGTTDFTVFVQKWKEAGAEIITGVPIPPDWAACWRQCAQAGFKPKIASIGKAILFPAAVEAIGGSLPEGLSSEVWWSPAHPYKSSLTGESAGELAGAFPQQWSQPLGFVYALFEIAGDVLARAKTTDKEMVKKALAATRLDTIVGPISFDDKHVGRTPLVGGQWTKGDKYPWDLRVVYNETAPAIKKTAELKAIG
ncbi:MAG TPA: ABC transporter substrate-binding protein [Kofleriaceae bacterium]|nr:ABC transporter substrate-binding protein [Kofleriaceae bacterium]